ncbi:hypothetical protein EAE96_002257 [Botrytis aclada]|nr:hypothetical protein EAE96_002257 [Botrytis aclada]
MTKREEEEEEEEEEERKASTNIIRFKKVYGILLMYHQRCQVGKIGVRYLNFWAKLGVRPVNNWYNDGPIS